MSFLAERDMAAKALEYRGPGLGPGFPSVASRIRMARGRLGGGVEDFAARWGLELSAYRDLELADDALFTTVALGDIPVLASELELPVMVLLFGEVPLRPIARISYRDVATAIAKRLSRDGLSADQLSEAVGVDLQPVLDEPEVLRGFNLRAVLDVCLAVRLDWVGLLDAVAEGAA